MTRRRFYAPPSAFDATENRLTLASDEAHHLREVLRLKAGEEVDVFDGEGKQFHCRIEESGREVAFLTVIAQSEPARRESPLKLTMGVALLKGEKFDLVVQKVTELGVTRIVPVVTKLADIRLRDESDAAKRVARWQRIALEGAKQCGRAFVPEVSNPVSLESLIEQQRLEVEHCVMFSERDGQSLLRTREQLPPMPTSLASLVGSEGGWTKDEIERARAAGWIVTTLGGRTLRAETAAITVAALLQHLYGDLA
ncbi:MAG: 16S rRNA (uracil(1498)-N(3))-methyltransferase [Pyrinomonadaceae bacterium]